jgi:hypothetical protein
MVLPGLNATGGPKGLNGDLQIAKAPWQNRRSEMLKDTKQLVIVTKTNKELICWTVSDRPTNLRHIYCFT